MRLWHSCVARLRSLLLRSRTEGELSEELQFHIEQETERGVAEGLTSEQARLQALRTFGGPEQVKEECRDARGTRWLVDLLRDFRYTLRTFRQRPGFVAVALLTLALGSGATTVMFTVINGVLLKPLPYPEPDRLVRLQEITETPTQFGNLWAFAYPNFLDVARESRVLAPMAAMRYTGGIVSQPGVPEYVDGREISSELFSVLGVTLFRGRAFQPEEDQPGAAPVVIISHDMWQSRYGGNPAAIGLPLIFEGRPYTVVGVTPPGFRLQGAELGVFTALGQNTQPFMRNREAHPGIEVWGRLRSGARLEEAQTELTTIAARLEAQYPASNAGRSFLAEMLRPEVGNVRSTLWLLLGAVSLVLLIACANVASLLLARAVSRERELALRVALGAGRGRLVRQCLTESAALGLAGGVLGILLAAMAIQPFVLFWPGSLPRAEQIQLEWYVLVFALGVSLLNGFLFGLAPALRVPTRRLEERLRAGARTIAGSSRRLHGAFVVSEVALAVVLLVSAGMLGRTLLHLSSLDPGVDVRNVFVTRVALSPTARSSPALIRAAWQDILDRARAVPGVQSIAMVDTVPMRQGNNQLGYSASPVLPPRNERPIALATSVTPDYLKVMGMRLLRGRFIDDQDRQDSQPVVVIDEVFAQNAFGGLDAVGKRLWIPDMGSEPLQVVGVVGHVRHWGLASDDQSNVRAQFYYPFAQVPNQLLRRWSELMSIAVRTGIDPLSVVEPLRREIRASSGDQVIYQERTLEQLAGGTLTRQRLLLLLFATFAGLALVLACVGIYGVMAYLTSQRVPEIGVRMTLGARAGVVLWMVLRQSLRMVFMGVAVGLCASWAAANLLVRQVEGMRSMEPLTFATMVSVLVVAALVASFIPAYRASRIDPISALRQE